MERQDFFLAVHQKSMSDCLKKKITTAASRDAALWHDFRIEL